MLRRRRRLARLHEGEASLARMRHVWLIALMLVFVAPASAEGTDCPEKSYTVGQYERHTVATHRDCTVDITLNENIICLGGGVQRTDYTVGPVNVTSYGCSYPGFPPFELVEFQHVNIYVPEHTACTWSGSYKPEVQTPVATVWMYSCDSGGT